MDGCEIKVRMEGRDEKCGRRVEEGRRVCAAHRRRIKRGLPVGEPIRDAGYHRNRLGEAAIRFTDAKAALEEAADAYAEAEADRDFTEARGALLEAARAVASIERSLGRASASP